MCILPKRYVDWGLELVVKLALLGKVTRHAYKVCGIT
jgi:hypothetical protein